MMTLRVPITKSSKLGDIFTVHIISRLEFLLQFPLKEASFLTTAGCYLSGEPVLLQLDTPQPFEQKYDPIS